MQKGQLTQWIKQIWVVGTITFSAKRSNHTVGYAVGMQYPVGVSAKKVNSHSGLSKYGMVGTVTFSAIRSNPHSGVHSRCAVQSRYAVRSRC